MNACDHAGFHSGQGRYTADSAELRAVFRGAELIAEKTPDVLILGNHGLVVAAADCEAAAALMQEVERRLELPVRAAPAPDLARLQTLCADGSYRPATEPDIRALLEAAY